MTTAKRLVLAVLDGLRPDVVTPELTPNLARLVQRGVWFERSHAVVPTVTRVNSATIATGTRPATHGLPANLVFAPRVDPSGPLSLGEGDTVPALMREYGVFAAPTLADVVADAGGRTALLSTGTRGSALMLDPRRAARGHLTLHPTLSTDAELALAAEHVGPLPEAAVPDSPRNRWLARAGAEWVVPELRPDLLMLWFDDPDKSQHRFGFGHPDSLAAIRMADAGLGAILNAVDAAGLRDETMVAVASDHGYVSVREHVDLSERLAAAGLDRTDDGQPVVLGQNGGAVLMYAPGASDRELARRVEALLAWPEVGVVFADHQGRAIVDGTAPLAAIGAGGPIAPDLVVTLTWDDDPNVYGWRGRSAEQGPTNRASHGGASSWEIRNTLLLAGPGVSSGVRSSLPSGSIDLAPTLLSLLGLPIPPGVDGRVLREAFAETASPSGEAQPSHRSEADRSDVERIPCGAGTVELSWSSYAGHRYLDSARRVRDR